MTSQHRIHYLAMLTISMALAGSSNPDDAPDDALQIFDRILRTHCMDPDKMKDREKICVHKALLRQALAIATR